MDDILLKADDLGIRLEVIGGLPVWEASPVLKHQLAIDRIRASIQPSTRLDSEDACKCIHVSDVYISFPDGSLMRPDVAVFCRMPEEEEEAIRLIPEAVIEVISKGYEAKDLELAPRLYLSQGVKDVVVFDPYTLLVLYLRREGARRLVSPVKIDLECGCTCEV